MILSVRRSITCHALRFAVSAVRWNGGCIIGARVFELAAIHVGHYKRNPSELVSFS